MMMMMTTTRTKIMQGGSTDAFGNGADSDPCDEHGKADGKEDSDEDGHGPVLV